jgi:hypothetical protein
MKKRELFSLTFVLVLILGLVSCATYKQTQTDAQSIDAYACRTKVEGVSCAADPYDTPEKAKKGFYEDISSKGFYAIQLIIANETPDRILILRDNVELVDFTGNAYRSVRSQIMSEAFEHDKMSYAVLGFGILSYMSADDANKKMATDWRDKEIPDQLIILPSRKTNGFVYFKLPEGKSPKGCTLRFEAEQLESRKKLLIELKI